MRPIRVVHVPTKHLYVEHLSGLDPTDAPGFASLEDVSLAGCAPGPWSPPATLDPAWISDNASRFDLMHVHFGFESFSLPHLIACCDALDAAGRPLVYTVHDLENPQLIDQTHHEHQLDVLMARATEITTLTASAAREITSRWGRRVTVIKHPHLLTGSATEPESTPGPRATPIAVIGMHLGDLRPGTDPLLFTSNLIDAIRSVRREGFLVEAEIHIRPEVRDEPARRAVEELCRRTDGVRLLEHARSSDGDLSRSVAALDACVLPYRHGTHSGWIELCFDLAVPVLAPVGGHWLDQHHEPGAVTAFDPGSMESLAAAITATITDRAGEDRYSLRMRRRRQRQQQGRVIARTHLDVYRSALDRAAAVTR